MKVSIVIPNYNSGQTLVKNLPFFLETAVDEIVIVDDKSTDDSMEKIRSFEKTRFLTKSLLFRFAQNNKNLGFSSTINRGVQEATGDIVVLLNTDVLPEKDFLQFLVPHFLDPKVFAVGCMDKSMENGKIVLRGRGLGEWKRGFYMHQRGEIDRTDTDWISCGSGAFRKTIWDELYGLDEIYNPFYWEDIDLSFRAKKRSYKLLFEPKSIVIHKHEEGAIKQKYSAEQIKTISYRNQFLFVWKNMGNFKLWFLHFFWLPYHFIKAVTRGDFALYSGFFHALTRIRFWTSQNDGK